MAGTARASPREEWQGTAGEAEKGRHQATRGDAMRGQAMRGEAGLEARGGPGQGEAATRQGKARQATARRGEVKALEGARARQGETKRDRVVVVWEVETTEETLSVLELWSARAAGAQAAQLPNS